MGFVKAWVTSEKLIFNWIEPNFMVVSKNIKTTCLPVVTRVLCIFALKMAHGPHSVCVCAFKSPPFIISKQFIHACRRVQGPGGRGWAIHQSSFIRPDDDRYPSSDPELARPQSSATIWAAGISSNSPTPTSTSAQTTSGAALSFAKLSHNFKDGPSGDGCCSEGLLISFLMPKYVYYETIAMYW